MAEKEPRVKVLPDDTVTLEINGKSLPGFRKTEQWEGMVKFQKGTDYVILDVASGNNDGAPIAKISPKFKERLFPPAPDKPPLAEAAAAGATPPGPPNPPKPANDQPVG